MKADRRGPAAAGDPPEAPSVDALVAGSLALMTAWAERSAAGDDAPPCRQLIARKLVHNLAALGRHPGIDPRLAVVVGRMQARWAQLVQPDMAPAAPARPVH